MNTTITNMFQSLTPIFQAAYDFCIARPLNSRMPSKEIIVQVAKNLGMSFADVSGALGYFLHQTESQGIGYITRGKNGGWVRGVRKVSVKPSPEVIDTVITELGTEVANDNNDEEMEENEEINQEIAV